MSKFKDLGLSPEILRALDEIGFETPTKIQEQAIPVLLERNPDIIALAQTGTGKTAAFGLPLLDVIDDSSDNIKAIVLAPTRELAQQIANEFENFGKYKKGLGVTTVYGGAAISNQIKEIKSKRPNVIIATPGRLQDLINRRIVKLHDMSHLVLDEADEMLNMGFQEEIDQILESCPPTKTTWLFSATMPNSVRRIINNYMNDPEEVEIDREFITNPNLSHKYVLVDRRDKKEALKRVIDYIPDLYSVVFCRTKRDTEELAESLVKDGYRADCLNGDLSQAQRDTVMKKFRSKAINILVATDVAARGIDVNDLTHVFHFTLPDNVEYYTHRSGRTARAGKEGVSMTILIPKDKRKMKNFEKDLKIEFERVLIPKYADLINQRIKIWTQKIIETDETSLKPALLDRVLSQLDGIDKDVIIAKLLARQLHNVKQTGAKDDLNIDESRKRDRGDRRGGRDRGDRRDRGNRRDRGDRRDRRDRDRGEGRGRRSDREGGRRNDDRRSRKDGMTEMFINIGKMDKMKRVDLLDFVSSNTNIKKSAIGDINMQKMHTTFEVQSDVAKQIAKGLESAKLNGRPIRCNKK